MGRKNSRNREPFYDEELYREFRDMPNMYDRKMEGPRIKDLQLKSIIPLTDNQRKSFEQYLNGQHLILHGAPGSGKTFIALYLSLNDVILRKYEKVFIVRSAVPSREIGYLPGGLDEKIDVYKAPYRSICSKFFDIADAFTRLEKLGYIEFIPTSFLRGITFDNCIIIVDECQNMNDMELHTIMTRVGLNCKIIFSGDFSQTDLNRKGDMSGLKKFLAIADTMPSFSKIEFGIEDIVRSDIVKEYIIARLKYEEND